MVALHVAGLVEEHRNVLAAGVAARPVHSMWLASSPSRAILAKCAYGNHERSRIRPVDLVASTIGPGRKVAGCRVVGLSRTLVPDPGRSFAPVQAVVEMGGSIVVGSRSHLEPETGMPHFGVGVNIVADLRNHPALQTGNPYSQLPAVAGSSQVVVQRDMAGPDQELMRRQPRVSMREALVIRARTLVGFQGNV